MTDVPDDNAGPNDIGAAWLLDGLERSTIEKTKMSAADALRELGGDPAPPAPVPLTAADAVRELGGDAREQLLASWEQPDRRRRPSKRHALAQARAALGEPSRHQRFKDEHKRRWLATEWRYYVLSRCGLRKEQERLVAFLESSLDGTETELPDTVRETVERIIKFDSRHSSDPRPRVPWAVHYQRLAEAWHRSDAEAS